jgi:glycogen phosphorylase
MLSDKGDHAVHGSRKETGVMRLASTTSARASIEYRLKYSLGKDPEHATEQDWRTALSLWLRDAVVDTWFASTRRTYIEKKKRVYYLSMEFLIGRLIEDVAVNLRLEDQARAAIEGLGLDYRSVVADEPDAALGNGGLGRLAACFLDSLSTLGIPAYGYGIRYEHGLFRQGFEDGRQIETPEDWLQQRHVWEFERPEVTYEIGFGGEVGADGFSWQPETTVLAAAYDTPVVGWGGRWTNTLRLWTAKPTRDFDLERFNKGEFLMATAPEALARTISRVLYPNDSTAEGRDLRLKQEYFFAAASVRDILRRFLSEYDDLRLLPQKVAIQLNDTHPAIAAPELVRLLADEHKMTMTEAIETAQGCLAYTNHTLLPEALESWPEEMIARALPRHYQIIGAIEDWQARRIGPRPDAPRIVSRGAVNMGALSFVTSHRVNGVSELHTRLMKETVFAGFDRLHPDRIVNQTNGVTPRRWLLGCNPDLSRLLDETVGEGWPTELERLEGLRHRLDDTGFLDRFAAAKLRNKERMAAWLRAEHAVGVDPSAMFDVQIKRFHEYKRQLMNLLETVALWLEMRDDPGRGWTPRVKVFGGKAAPGYYEAKEIIRLINDVARVVNADPVTRDLLQIVFPPNYNVSMAEILIPAADLSEQISTAGAEASGTGNMKLALNGAPIIGTLDGANVEIRERVGADNFFLFGMTAEEVAARRAQPDFARAAIAASPRLGRVLHEIARGAFSRDEPGRYGGLVGRLYDHDRFLVTCDFDGYFTAQRRADEVFRDPRRWSRMAAANTAFCGWFSSDRTIRSYARDIWGIEVAELEAPLESAREAAAG